MYGCICGFVFFMTFGYYIYIYRGGMIGGSFIVDVSSGFSLGRLVEGLIRAVESSVGRNEVEWRIVGVYSRKKRCMF